MGIEQRRIVQSFVEKAPQVDDPGLAGQSLRQDDRRESLQEGRSHCRHWGYNDTQSAADTAQPHANPASADRRTRARTTWALTYTRRGIFIALVTGALA